MINKKAIAWFLGITFCTSWILFTLPLAFQSYQENFAQIIQVFFAVAMWGPGTAAIITTLVVEKNLSKVYG